PQGGCLDRTLPEQSIATAAGRRRADRVIWAGLGRWPDPERDIPTIAIEFVSSGKRDRDRDYVEKQQEYEAIGIGEYWLIDRFRRIMLVYRAGMPALIIKETETYSTPLLPGIVLPLGRLLELADLCDADKRKNASVEHISRADV